MYQHLLVPVDGTEASIDVVGQAVGLARALGARISFLHLGPTDPPNAADIARAGERLAKAAAAARACGVPCDGLQCADPAPAQAIATTARARDCDLVFMAAPVTTGPQAAEPPGTAAGPALPAGLSVLLVAPSDAPAAARAIGVLRDEHRALAVVLQAWQQALAVPVTRPPLLRAIVQYLQAFSTGWHHPKEDEQLFRQLRVRSPALALELDELERQHRRDRQWLAELQAQVEALCQAQEDADEPRRQTLTQALAADLARYVDFVWDHLGREEGVILPAARRLLSAGDWAAIDASFAAAAAAADGARAGTPAGDLARILALAADTGPV